MIIVDPTLPKLCHREAGQVIRIEPTTDEKTPAGIYMICRFDTGKTKRCSWAPSGLYTEENPLFLVNLANGEAVKMPHLSTRIEHIPNPQLILGEPLVK